MTPALDLSGGAAPEIPGAPCRARRGLAALAGVNSLFDGVTQLEKGPDCDPGLGGFDSRTSSKAWGGLSGGSVVAGEFFKARGGLR